MSAAVVVSLLSDDEEEEDVPGRVTTEQGGADKKAQPDQDPKPAQAPPAQGPAQADPTECIICMEPLEDKGSHRVTVTTCGHTFGRGCMEKWIVGAGKGKGSCPTCKKKLQLKDLIELWNMPTVEAGGAAHARDLEAKLAKAEREKQEAERQMKQREKENERLRRELQQEKVRQQRREKELQQERDQERQVTEKQRNKLLLQQQNMQQQQQQQQHVGAAGTLLQQATHHQQQQQQPHLGVAGAPLQQATHQQQPQGRVSGAGNLQQAQRLTAAGEAALRRLQATGLAEDAALPPHLSQHQQGLPQHLMQQQGLPPHLIQQQQGPPSGLAAAFAPALLPLLHFDLSGALHNPGLQQFGQQGPQFGQQGPPTFQQHDGALQMIPGPYHPMQQGGVPSLGPGHHHPFQHGSFPHISGPMQQYRQLQGPAIWPLHMAGPPVPPPLPARLLVSYQLREGRCFDINVDQSMLLASSIDGDRPTLLKASLHIPNACRLVPLPDPLGFVRDIRLHPTNKLAALATSTVLVVVSTITDQPIAHWPGDVWACTWSKTKDYLVYAGLSKGQVAVYDIRQAGAALVTFTLPNQQGPVHSIQECVVKAWRESVHEITVAFLLAATPGGVWQVRQLGGVVAPLVTPPRGGGTLESAVLQEPCSGTLHPNLVLSWRPLAVAGAGSGHEHSSGQQPEAASGGHGNVQGQPQPDSRRAQGNTQQGQPHPGSGHAHSDVQQGQGQPGSGHAHNNVQSQAHMGSDHALPGVRSSGAAMVPAAAAGGHEQVHPLDNLSTAGHHRVYSLIPDYGVLPRPGEAPQVLLLAQERTGERIMSGHKSHMYMTKAALLPPCTTTALNQPPGPFTGPYLAHADEASCQPWVWDVSSMQVVAALPAHSTPVLQLVAGVSSNMGVLLGALSSGMVQVVQVL